MRYGTHHVELMVGDFARRGLPDRWHHAVVPRQQQVLKLHLIRRNPERVELANGAESDAVRVDLFDDLTLFKNWIDGEGNLLLMETETQRMRVIRDPDMEREKADS